MNPTLFYNLLIPGREIDYIEKNDRLEKYLADVTSAKIVKRYDRKFGLDLSVFPDGLMDRSVLIGLEAVESFLDELKLNCVDNIIYRNVVAYMEPLGSRVIAVSAHDPNDNSVRDERLVTKVRILSEFVNRSRTAWF